MNTVKSNDLLRLLKTCGVIVIDVSRDIASLKKGKELFKSLKREILNILGKGDNPALKKKRLIVVISTVMTWAGVDKRVSQQLKKY